MTSTTARPVSRSIARGARTRTAAQRLLRSLNSLGVIVADSTQTAQDIEPANSPGPRRPGLDTPR